MSAQARTSGTGGAGPEGRAPDHRKGRSPILLYVIGLVVVLAVGGGVLWATGALRGVFGPQPAPKPEATSTPPGTASKPATPSAAPSATPLPESAAAESAAAVKAAALPYPNPPAVTPQSISRVRPSRKLVAITLDDGIPFDTRILDLFEQKNIRLTTFLLGQAVKARPDLMKRLDRDGFEIANHTWDHKTLTKLSDAEIRSELRRTQDAISAITGNQAPYMRPPGGATNARVRRVAASMGFRVVLWNKTFADTSKYATPDKLFHNVMDGLKPGDIILGHWGGRSTYEALQLILPEMEKRGFTPVTLSELLKYSSTGAGAAASEGQGGAGIPAPTSAEATETTGPAGRRTGARPAAFNK